MGKTKFLIVGLGVLACGTRAAWGETGIKFELTADFLGKYIWRGQNLSDDPVFQPSISARYGGLTAAIWGNLEFSDINGSRGDFSELDYSLDYSSSIPGMEGIEYSMGVIYYDFPGTASSGTTEVYSGLGFDDLPFSPSITVYHDVDEAEGTYVSLGAGHSVEKVVEFGPDVPVGMEIGASFGWGSGSYNKYYWGTDQTKVNDLVLSASFPFKVADLTVTPSANYVTLLSDNVRRTDTYGTNSDFFFAGISLLKKF